MSAFCVFGMTEQTARELAAKKPPPAAVRTEDDAREWREKRVEHILENFAARQVSPLYDAPQFCHDWIQLATKTTRARGLVVMVRDTKVGKNGEPVVNKRTQKIVKTWRKWR